MRRKIELYINGSLADIATDALVLMNYKLTDAESPTAVYNSWSQTVVLPRTSKNNAIFDHIYRADHETTSGKFNALVRTPFVIYNEQGEILESGYLKLTDITETQYSATLYGGLGGFFFSLMYNSDGSRKTLADLQYTENGGDSELDFNITRDAVREAWRTINGQQAHSDLWNIINFAPCYNGIPGGVFDAKRAFCYDGCFGVKSEDGNYKSRRSHVLVDLVNDMDEWATQDLRSYQQRPAVKVKAIFDAIKRYATAQGYDLYYDAVWFNNNNPLYGKTWLTLPKLDSIQLPNESGSGTDTITSTGAGAAPAYDETSVFSKSFAGSWVNKGVNAKHSVSVTFTPTINAAAGGRFLTSWETPDSPNGRRYWRVVAMYQLLAYDTDGVCIGGSKVAAASCKTRCSDDATPMETTISPASFISKYNNAISTHWNTFTPGWIPDDGDTYESSMVNGDFYYGSSGDGTRKLCDNNFDELTITLNVEDIAGMADLRLRTTYLAIYSTGGVGMRYYQNIVTDVPIYNMSYTETLNFVSFVDGQASYSYTVSGTARSGAHITKKLLLGGTHTPADYLLSYCKMFGLYFIVSDDGKSIEVRTRGSAYHLVDNVLDFQERIHLPSKKIVPYVVKSRWYDYVHEVQGRFAEYYKSVYGLEYGMARVNTGFEFDASHNEVLKDSAFKGAAEVLHQGKYFENVTESGKTCPPPFLDGGSFTLWNASDESQEFPVTTPSDAATIAYINTTYLGYDYSSYPKPEFCDKDNKEIDGSDVLLMYDGGGGPAQYGRFTLTDDNGLMTLYNEGKPCWLLGQSAIASNAKYTIGFRNDGSTLYFPRFRRMYDGGGSSVTYSLDMAIPQEIDQPTITVPESAGVYYRRFRNYMNDRLNADTKVCTCKVNLQGLQVGRALIGRICYFDGSLWALENIKNYVLGGDDLTECEFVKVNDINKYHTGQN